jgi:hypothetical protein
VTVGGKNNLERADILTSPFQINNGIFHQAAGKHAIFA